MKKSNQKSNKARRYNSRNIYGQRCVGKVLKLEKESAVQQLLDAQTDILNQNVNVEYTIDCSCFTNNEELREVYDRCTQILEFRAKLAGKGFRNYGHIEIENPFRIAT